MGRKTGKETGWDAGMPIDNDTLREHVWEALNRIGHSIHGIREEGGRNFAGAGRNLKSKDKPIWHSKTEVDRYVADEMGIDTSVYENPTRNPFYNKVADEIKRLRNNGMIIDWAKTPKKRAGVGIWRLDKTRFEGWARKNAAKRIRDGDYYMDGYEATIKVRAMQGGFRTVLMDEYRKCALCGFKIRDYMVGAHIVPYYVMRERDPGNSMNPANGLLLCKLCDVAFEKGYIAVKENLEVAKHSNLAKNCSVPVKSWVANVAGEVRLRKGMEYSPDPEFLRKKIALIPQDILAGHDGI